MFTTHLYFSLRLCCACLIIVGLLAYIFTKPVVAETATSVVAMHSTPASTSTPTEPVIAEAVHECPAGPNKSADSSMHATLECFFSNMAIAVVYHY